ncbi:hypothetical protein [Liquorilactobacillus capillatus]|uniref:hypothetical protein n=1 Tax=Liquorilactobacillus capillatus TaxID=480931 RepID=UPI000A8CE516|nr:hypothetical protein [Liquorilactobacillus capillatus]
MPGDIVTSAIISLGVILLRIIFNKCSKHFFIIKRCLSNLPSAFNEKKPNMSYQIIPSPSYRFSDRKSRTFQKVSLSTLFWFLLILVFGALALKDYQHIVQIDIYAISLFFISSGLICITVSAITNKIQKSTLMFSIFSVLLSFYIYHNANILPAMVAKIPSDFSMKLLFWNNSVFFATIYIFLGLIVAIVEMILVACLFLRMFAIKVDSIKSIKVLQRIINKTEILDGFKNVSLMFVVFTTLSYLLTSGIVTKYVLKSFY